MRSVKLTIKGAFWDSQIYSGELLLFDADGAVHRVEWREVIDNIAEKNTSIQTAVRVAFSDSDLFYNAKVRKILRDPLIESPIKQQLSSLSDLSLCGTRTDWKKNWKTEDTPFNFLPTDTEVYYNQIIAAGDEGLFSTPRSGLAHGRLFGKPTSKHLDAKVLQVKASDRFTAVAAAAGQDGLFEFAFRRGEDDVLDSQRQLAKRPCSSCDWAFQSVMGWSTGSAFLANFRQRIEPNSRRTTREFDRIVETTEIFGSLSATSRPSEFSWGCREKFYRIVDNNIEVSNYTPILKSNKKSKTKNEEAQTQFARRGLVSVNFDTSSIVATGTAPFGTVLEFDDRLVVMRSDGTTEEFAGEPVHWRVFPRSEHYSNQLHIIYDDRLEIVSFVHDYFVDQASKLSGFSRAVKDTNLESVD